MMIGEMRQEHAFLGFETQGKAMLEITQDITSWVRATGISSGMVTLLCQHTSAGLMINENAAQAVQHDLNAWMETQAPEGDHYQHDTEGPDDMPAHIRTMLSGVNLSIPMLDGRLMLGTWQGIFLVEHRAEPKKRHVAIHLIGQ